MNSISRFAHVPYSAHEMYELVADVESYPQFLPWCRGARIIARDEVSTVAALDVAFSVLHKSFTTRNRLYPVQAIDMQLVEGPFKHLQGRWRFDALAPQASRISLDLQFDFSNRLAGATLSPVFTQIADTLVDSFKHRATMVYGERSWQA